MLGSKSQWHYRGLPGLADFTTACMQSILSRQHLIYPVLIDLQRTFLNWEEPLQEVREVTELH